jgi:hypothetical protein
MKQSIKTQMIRSIEAAKREYKPNSRSDVVKIQGTNTCSNSINILIGAQSSGKTFTALNEAIVIAEQMPEVHLIALFSKKQYDETVEGVRHLAPVPIVTIPYEEAENFVSDLIEAKNLYRKIRRAIYDVEDKGVNPENQEKITEDELDNMLSILGVEDISRRWLNTIIILDDVGGSNLFNKESSAFNNWLRLSRDLNVIWFLALHSITQLPPSIRSNSAVVYISKLNSMERFGIIHRTTNNCVDWETFKSAVQQLKQSPKYRWLVCNNIEGSLKFE